MDKKLKMTEHKKIVPATVKGDEVNEAPIIVVKDLPTEQVRTIVDKKTNVSYNLITSDEALTDILRLVSENNKMLKSLESK